MCYGCRAVNCFQSKSRGTQEDASRTRLLIKERVAGRIDRGQHGPTLTTLEWGLERLNSSYRRKTTISNIPLGETEYVG